MRRLLPLFLFLALLWPDLAAAQPFNAQIEAARGYHKSYTTALLPARCRPGTEAFDTTLQVTKVCLNDGATWAVAGGGGTAGNITAGTTTITGCAIGQVLYEALDGTVGCEASLNYSSGDNNLRVDGGIIMGGVSSAFPKLTYSTIQTPDAPVFGVGSLARNLFFGVNGAESNDFGNVPCAGVACANPQFTLVGISNDPAQYTSLSYAGTAGKAITAINDGVATGVVQVPVAQGNAVGGGIDYTISVAAGADFQALSGSMLFAAVNKAGTVTCTTGAGITTTAAVSAVSTLVCTFTCAENPADTLEIRFNCDSSLTTPTVEAWTQTHLIGAGTISQQ